MAIDMINRASVQDDMILFSQTRGDGNLDALVRDVVLNTVSEVPQLQLSLNTLDAFYNVIGRNTRSSPMSRQELQQKLEGGRAVRLYPHRSLVAQLWLDICVQMADRSHEPMYDGQPNSTVLARKLGADRVSEWRLSANWQASYPRFGDGTGEPGS